MLQGEALAWEPEYALAHYNLAIMFAEAEIYREAINEWTSHEDMEG